MLYKVEMPEFEGPLDLLLHLIKQSDINIYDISIELITKQYLDYINQMEELNLNVASEYLVMAAELIEMKSALLLPKQVVESEDDYEEDPREQLINRLLEYQAYKNITSVLKEYENERSLLYTKAPSNLEEYAPTNDVEEDTSQINLEDLIDAISQFLLRKEVEKPLNTKVTTKELSVAVRSDEIKAIVKKYKKVEFTDLFEVYSRDYIVITFLSILELTKKQELQINQDDNFKKIYVMTKGSE
ncbi:MAG: segregation/condensation protein A [Bacilli bacterium]|nr:segregation/condensation protein A [Bacilli bacterium]MDD4607666.1 segregation/condensation protein A [Bacilli bacterium]